MELFVECEDEASHNEKVLLFSDTKAFTIFDAQAFTIFHVDDVPGESVAGSLHAVLDQYVEHAFRHDENSTEPAVRVHRWEPKIDAGVSFDGPLEPKAIYHEELGVRFANGYASFALRFSGVSPYSAIVRYGKHADRGYIVKVEIPRASFVSREGLSEAAARVYKNDESGWPIDLDLAFLACKLSEFDDDQTEAMLYFARKQKCIHADFDKNDVLAMQELLGFWDWPRLSSALDELEDLLTSKFGSLGISRCPWWNANRVTDGTFFQPCVPPYEDADSDDF